MTPSVIFSEKAASELQKLPFDIQERVKKKLFLVRTTPFNYFERLAGRPDYKLRIGDYRIIADINQTEQKIEITKVGHRKNIYKKLP